MWVELDEDEVAPEPRDLRPPEPETCEEYLAMLRQSIADAQAGRTQPANEVLAELSAEFGLDDSK